MPDIHREDWAELAPFERNCAFWTETHRLALASLADHPFTHRLRLEDVRDRTVRAQVLDFFEVDLPRGTQSLRSVRRPANSKLKFKVSVRMHKHDMLPRYDKWTAAQREALRELCGETARTLGYAL